eukprot:GHVN01056701.1.p3 GENE.GHVN01056701.1~~GHVN01056701.1.p3  ORF type:complete len:143 (-),score=16.88 GHVN01056701.1:278-706(-)
MNNVELQWVANPTNCVFGWNTNFVIYAPAIPQSQRGRQKPSLRLLFSIFPSLTSLTNTPLFCPLVNSLTIPNPVQLAPVTGLITMLSFSKPIVSSVHSSFRIGYSMITSNRWSKTSPSESKAGKSSGLCLSLLAHSFPQSSP